MDEPPAHAWLRPRLIALLGEAASTGIAHEVAVAVLIDLMTGTDFNLAAPNPEPERGKAAAGGYRDTSVTED
jgi:hypothetical protein